MTLELYTQKYDDLQTLHLEASEFGQQTQKEFDTELLNLYKKLFPKRKYDKSKALKLDEGKALYDKRYEEYQKKDNQLDERKKEICKELDELAQTIQVPTVEEFYTHNWVQESSYRSQGMGAAKYARGNAEMDAEHATRFGIESKVERVEHREEYNGKPFTWVEYKVMAKTSTVGWDILNRKKLKLQDFIKSCEDKHMNPRVMMPWLPASI